MFDEFSTYHRGTTTVAANDTDNSGILASGSSVSYENVAEIDRKNEADS
jgi:hypothetical protein